MTSHALLFDPKKKTDTNKIKMWKNSRKKLQGRKNGRKTDRQKERKKERKK